MQEVNSETKIPKVMIEVVLAICVLPFLLNLLGVDFSTQGKVVADANAVDAGFYKLQGAFTHTLLEWSAFMTAIFTIILAFVHFKVKQDIVTPLIGMTLFFAGSMDAFHTLAATRLIEAVADNKNLIPFTWAICRLFNPLILIAGIGIIMWGKKQKSAANFQMIMLSSLLFGVIAYMIIHYSATSVTLPQTMFPDSIITRPYDVAPLVIFIVAGLFVLPHFCRNNPSLFSHALLISMIPNIATQLHMAFGSTALFDNHFNIAHFIKILAYMVPFGGLCLDYVRTYQAEKEVKRELQKSEIRVRSILESAVNGIITISDRGILETFNPAATEIFGYTEGEVIGKNVKMLMPEPYHSKHDSYLSRYSQTEEKKIIGLGGREVIGRRKNGNTFPMELAVSEMQLNEERMFVGLVTNITDRKKTEEALVKAKNDAETANRLKSEFLNIMSHELRTPLTVMLGNLPLITEKDDLPDSEEIAEIALDIEDSGNHLLTLINDLLDLSKIEAGKMELHQQDILIETAVKEATKTITVLTEKKGITLETALEEGAKVYADPIRLKQILINLLGNAVKFTGSGGTITVRARCNPDKVLLEVQDTGCGMDKKDLPYIFDVFRQVDGSSTRKANGTGLGLTITKKLVELHGGEIVATSKIGEGSAFSFSIATGRKK